MRPQSKRLQIAALLLVVVTLLSGCVYLRLLELKHQIAAFDRNFRVDTAVGVRITCEHPVLLADDVRWLGLAPETSRRVGTAEEWQVRWVKQLPPGVKEDGAFDITLELLFVQDRLTRVTIPEQYFAVMPKSLLLDLLRSLGGARVDKGDRSVEAELAAARPDLPGIKTLLGRPTSSTTQNGETAFRYRYIPVTATGLARSATFDMTVHFDDATGQMTRWEGRTPVGNVGFNFAGADRGEPAKPL